ncbi:hypothetical protein INT47_003132 [Mucor saturninus]|uniref:Uncharacterized protein n=1 Tax=Mucor saturninus TaxID=64648 RepID=A0A8H7UQ47_9FUNG|nr:hypothetical protein INT47_003132 [Mucor saturninus]
MKVSGTTKFGLIFAATLLVSTMNVDAACQGDMTITSQNDMDQIRNCKTYSGNILIDNTAASDLRMNGVELLEGDLMVTNNNGLQGFGLPKLQGINGQLKFANNKLLSSIDVKQLYAIRSLEVSVHPALNELKFAAGLSQAEKIIIADTTCTRIDGFKMTTSKDIEISNNIYLKSLSFANMSSVGNILISANSPALILDLNTVSGLREGSFRNLAGIELTSLQKVSGDISFISNTFQSLDLPAAVDIIGTLTLTDNINLNNLSMSKLGHLGGALSVVGNNQLSSVNAFPSLQQVDGTLDLSGNFDEVQFPVLADVRGGLNVQTSSNVFACDDMNRLKAGVIKGNSFVCKSAVAKPKSGIKGVNGKGGSSGGRGGSDDSSASTQKSGFLVSLTAAAGAAAFAYMINI